MTAIRRWCWLACAWGLSCGPALPAAYSQHSDAARQATLEGRHADAARHWHAAAEAAPDAKNRDEAWYREASSLQRAGNHARARDVLKRLATAAKGERKIRSTFDAAYAQLEQGDETAGLDALERAIIAYPDSGLASGGVTRLLSRVSEKRGPSAEKRVLDRLWQRLREREVGQLLGYRRARWADAHGSPQQALPLYLETMRAHPYPLGRYWDEAALRAADLQVQLGNAQAALTLLKNMLSHRETSDFVGSYERHYSKARYRMAEIFRDELDDCRGAREHFLAVVDDFRTSLLRDDALWNAARCAERLGNLDQACADLERLVGDWPESRYAACANGICPTLPARGRCHPYLMNDSTTPKR